MKRFLFVIIPVSLLLLPAWKMLDTGKTVTWYLKDTRHIGNFSPIVLGNPVVKVEGKDSSIYFNGATDGLVIPVIPIESWSAFTIEVLFKPASDGPSAPRFIHFEDADLNRGTFELRLTKNSQWYLDGFLKNGKTNKGRTLIDSAKLHPANQWYWAALVYDGNKMYSYINGQKNRKISVKNEIGNHGYLKILNDENEISFYYSPDSKTWKKIERSIDATGFNHNIFGGFMSLRAGIFVVGKGKAVFDNFKYTKLTN